MPNSTLRHFSPVALSIAAGLAVLGCITAWGAEGTSSKKAPGDDSQITAPAKYDPATVKPATVKPGTVKPRTDKPASDDSDTDGPAAVKPGTVKPATKPASSASLAGPRKLRFQFRFVPWKDALDWFARQADLSLMADSTPPGTLNYSDQREYTPAEALDLLNGILLTKGYTLVRRERMLMLINLEDGIPPNLVPTITPDALDSRGEYELVSVLFNLKRLRPDEAEAEIARLLGPQGSVVPLPRARQILVTETAGRLRAIRSILKRVDEATGEIEGPEEVPGVPRARRIPLHNTQAHEMAEIVKQVYAGRMSEGAAVTPGLVLRTITPPRTTGSAGASNVPQGGVVEAGRPDERSLGITVGVDARSNSLIVVAPRALFQEVKQLVEELDAAAGDQAQTVRVVPLHGVTAEAVQQALSAAAGDLAQFGTRLPPIASGAPSAPGRQFSQPPVGQGAGATSGAVPRPQPSSPRRATPSVPVP